MFVCGKVMGACINLFVFWRMRVVRNGDQDKIRSAKRGKWNIDERVGDFQLDNEFYRSNPWDRGHLARRSSAAWGDSDEEAKEASDATMFYTNAVLQHENLNQDEWLALEDWVKMLEDDSTNKISVFSGPIYGDEGMARQFVRPRGKVAAEVPAAPFKVACFVGQSGGLDARAFLMVQDRLALLLLLIDNANSKRDLRP